MNKTRLSVNINKVALIRNARGGNLPNLKQFAKDCETFGAQGITVHPRPDERHIRFDDLPTLKEITQTEFNIEGNPTPKFMSEVIKVKPHQATLVPDDPQALTSDSGWDTMKHQKFLTDITQELQEAGIRVSLFVNADENMIEGARLIGADRVELYTGEYAKTFEKDKKRAIIPHIRAARLALQLELGLNAGHDLNLENLKFYNESLPNLAEVSIGHALVCDALYYGMHNTIQMYLKLLE